MKLKAIIAALVAAGAFSIGGNAVAACVGANLLVGGCSQTSGGAVSASGAAGTQAIIGFSASTANNNSQAVSANQSTSTPVQQNSTGVAATNSTSTQAGIALGLAGGQQGAVGGAGAAYNGAATGGLGINFYALPTP